MQSSTPLRRSQRLAAKRAMQTHAVSTNTVKRRRCLRSTPLPMTEEQFHQFNDSLSDEDKEIQANVLMWCIVHSIPYTIALFEKYKSTIQELQRMGVM
jgi:hypothetical protein